jgi:hypothetical protein
MEGAQKGNVHRVIESTSLRGQPHSSKARLDNPKCEGKMF